MWESRGGKVLRGGVTMVLECSQTKKQANLWAFGFGGCFVVVVVVVVIVVFCFYDGLS